MRLPLVLLIGGSVAGFGGATAAQSPPSTEEIVAQNPLVSQVAQLDPDRLKSDLARLAKLRETPVPEVPARGASPTEDELRQLAANPAFAEAYQNDPADTLALLRETNEDLEKARIEATPE